MATSGSFQSTALQGAWPGMLDTYMTFLVEWKRNSYSVSDLTSNITIQASVQSSNSDRLYPYNLLKKPSVTLTVDGNKVSPSINYIDTRNEKKCVFATWTGNVSHDTDDTLFLQIAISFTLDGASALTGGSAWGVAELDPIVSATTPALSSGTVGEGETVKVTMTPAISSYRHTLSWICGGDPVTFAEKVATEASLPITTDMLETIIANSATHPAAVTIQCVTYHGNTLVGTRNITLKVTIPQDARTLPVLSQDWSLSPTGSLPANFAGLFVQNKTGLTANVTGSKAQGGATLKTVQVEVAYSKSSQKTSTSASANTATLSKLTGTGYATVTVTLTDSRGFTVAGAKEITVWQYGNPQIKKTGSNAGIICRRSTDRIGLHIQALSACSSVDGKNDCKLTVKCRKRPSGSYSDPITLLSTADKFAQDVDGMTLEKEVAYDVVLTVTDTLGTSIDSEVFKVGAATCTIHEGKRGKNLGLGGFCDYDHGDNATEMWWDVFEHEDVRTIPYELTAEGSTDATMNAEMAAYHDNSDARDGYYRFVYQPNTPHSLLGPGPFLVEGYRPKSSYGWQRVTPVKAAVPLLYLRTQHEGTWSAWARIGEQKKPTYTKISIATDGKSASFPVSGYDALYLAIRPYTTAQPMWTTIPVTAETSSGLTFQVADESNYVIMTLTTAGITMTNGSGKIEAIYGVKY